MKPVITVDGSCLKGEGFEPGKAVRVIMKGAAVSSSYVHPDEWGNFELELEKATVPGEYFLEVQEVGDQGMPLTTGFVVKE